MQTQSTALDRRSITLKGPAHRIHTVLVRTLEPTVEELHRAVSSYQDLGDYAAIAAAIEDVTRWQKLAKQARLGTAAGGEVVSVELEAQSVDAVRSKAIGELAAAADQYSTALTSSPSEDPLDWAAYFRSEVHDLEQLVGQLGWDQPRTA